MQPTDIMDKYSGFCKCSQLPPSKVQRIIATLLFNKVLQHIWFHILTKHQLTLDLMGVSKNSFSPFSNEATEDSCFVQCCINHEVSLCRLICSKKKYVAFFVGDLDLAAKMCERTRQDFPKGPTGRFTAGLISEFVDGLIGFFFARKAKRLEDEAKWTNLGLDVLQSLRNWANSSDWNFSNKLYLLEAEFYFLKEDDERALACYHASIKAAREHRFVHEEGLAEEKAALYLLHKNRHGDAMTHLINAKKCYEVWGAHAVVQCVDKAIAILTPVCAGICKK